MDSESAKKPGMEEKSYPDAGAKKGSDLQCSRWPLATGIWPLVAVGYWLVANHMLSRINRLRNTKDIERVFRAGSGFKEGFLFLKISKNGLGATRFALTVSQKISRKAARRNEIKRRLREAVKFFLPQVKTGFDAIVVAQKGIENKNFQEIKVNTEKILKKAKLT